MRQQKENKHYTNLMSEFPPFIQRKPVDEFKKLEKDGYEHNGNKFKVEITKKHVQYLHPKRQYLSKEDLWIVDTCTRFLHMCENQTLEVCTRLEENIQEIVFIDLRNSKREFVFKLQIISDNEVERKKLLRDYGLMGKTRTKIENYSIFSLKSISDETGRKLALTDLSSQKYVSDILGPIIYSWKYKEIVVQNSFEYIPIEIY